MKILIYFGHPAQYFFLRQTIINLKQNNNEIIIVIKTKDVLEDLIKNDNLSYINILPNQRGTSRFSIGLTVIKRMYKLFLILIKEKPDLLIGSTESLSQLGKLLNINRIFPTEDDYLVMKGMADLSFPFTQTILCPTVCDVGKWSEKKIGYKGYMKLSYLHPDVFKVNEDIIKKYGLGSNFILIRLAKLTAYHDFGIEGINSDFLDQLILIFENKGYQIVISSEGDIKAKYEKYQLKLNPSDMHDILAKASLLICDSQSMSVEAAMLGIPSLRYNSFIGKISVLEELENVYKLTFGFKIEDQSKLLEKINELINDENLKEEFQRRRKVMLSDKINVTAFLTWFISEYPKSAEIMIQNPEYQNKFN